MIWTDSWCDPGSGPGAPFCDENQPVSPALDDSPESGTNIRSTDSPAGMPQSPHKEDDLASETPEN